MSPSNAYSRGECGFGRFGFVGQPPPSVVGEAQLLTPGTIDVFATLPLYPSQGLWAFDIAPDETWPAGLIKVRIRLDGVEGFVGKGEFRNNFLGADLQTDSTTYRRGEKIGISGQLFELRTGYPPGDQKTPVPGDYRLRVVSPRGKVLWTGPPLTAEEGGEPGAIAASVPAAVTEKLIASARTDFRITLAIEIVDATYEDATTGSWGAIRAGAASASLFIPPRQPVIRNSFVSDLGWVQPGRTYPSRIIVSNYASVPRVRAVVLIPRVPGMRYTKALPVDGSGRARVSHGSVRWTIKRIPPGTRTAPSVTALVLQGRASTLAADPRVVWKNLSTTARLTYRGGPRRGLASVSHGPKVIPKGTSFRTARYGDRPFPVVAVDYFDRKHGPSHNGAVLSEKINSPHVPGSTFNLYQEMSYGQLFPDAAVPSAGVATADFSVDWEHDHHQDGAFAFTAPDPQGACRGTTYGPFAGSTAYAERIVNGWYQLPGDTDYYGDDGAAQGFTAARGLPRAGGIDDGCGPTGKAVYDAAHIADPEIDYSVYDTDKDGVVDFFMMVFVGLGGNGVSQSQAVPYDNIWPHSSSLEFYYRSDLGNGYVSDDQLKDRKGRPLFYVDEQRNKMTTKNTGVPVFVRVGPYNVNPESAIDNASVISHEYGHSLGLPDFYSVGGRTTYGDWNLMATDKSQHMDIISKKKLGWLIPRVLKKGISRVRHWRDSKRNTHRIDWVTPAGRPYTLRGRRVNNGQGYVAKLKGRRVLSAKKIRAEASPTHVWWSGAGDGFGCTPNRGHNLDVYLPDLARLDPGTPVTVTFKSYWDIEWDYDYGFVMFSRDGGETFTSIPSQEGFTTSDNPNGMGCLDRHGNGLTGTSGSHAAGTVEVDRRLDEYPDGAFLEDAYDLTDAAGNETVLRFSYFTDSAVVHPGWFIDDLRITAGADPNEQIPIYDTRFERTNDPRLFNGGCARGLSTAPKCTKGWTHLSAATRTLQDHAYYLELRDRSGFDLEGRDENDRAPIAFLPGLLLTYSDELHGYGNVGVPDPPAQSPLDSVPQPGVLTPLLADAAFTDTPGDSHFSDWGKGHTDNYLDPSSTDGNWHFAYNCLAFDVLSMSGTGLGPANPPWDLRADVRFNLGKGCGKFDYGYKRSRARLNSLE